MLIITAFPGVFIVSGTLWFETNKKPPPSANMTHWTPLPSTYCCACVVRCPAAAHAQAPALQSPQTQDLQTTARAPNDPSPTAHLFRLCQWMLLLYRSRVEYLKQTIWRIRLKIFIWPSAEKVC